MDTIGAMQAANGESRMEYMRWAKTHRRVRYELTDSSVPAPDGHEFDTGCHNLDIEVKGTYGDPDLISAVAERYHADPNGVVPVPGASAANFIALAAILKHGDTVLIEHPVYEPVERVADLLGLRVLPIRRRASLAFETPLEDIEVGLRRGARAVVLTNLHNPSGQLLPIETVRHIAGTCRGAGATLIVDEVYLDSAQLNGKQPLWTAANVGDNVIGRAP